MTLYGKELMNPRIGFLPNENVSLWRQLSFFCLSTVILVAVTVLIGWILHSLSLILLQLNSSPMQFNTALSFLGCSMALFCLWYQQERLSQWIILLVTILNALILCQFLFGIDCGVDTFFIEPFTAINTVSKGRMAFNTNLGFLLMIGSLFLCTTRSSFSLLRALIISLFTSLIFVVGFVPVLGYLTQIETAYTWGSFTFMALHTALAFVLMSVAIISYAWSRSEKRTMWLPIPVFIALVTAAFSISAAIYTQETNSFAKTLESNTKSAAILTQQRLENLIQSLTRMSNRWTSSHRVDELLWRADAKAYIHDFSYLIALQRLDKDLRVESVEPFAENDYLLGKQLNNDPVRKHLISQAISTRKAVISDFLMLKQKRKGFLCFVPLFVDEQFDGMLVAVFPAKDFFGSIFTQSRFPSYYVKVYQKEKLIFSNTPSTLLVTDYPQEGALIHYENIEWRIKLYPNDVIAKRISSTYLVLFGIDFLMAVLVSLCIYLILGYVEKNHRLMEREERDRMIVNGVKDHAIFMLTPEGLVKTWNLGAERIEGYTDDEIIGKHFSLFYPPGEREKNKDVLSIAKTIGKYEDRVILIRKDNSQLWAQLLIETLYDNAQQLLGFVIIIRDNTDKQQLEMEHTKLIRLIEESTDFVGMADLEGHLQFHNKSAKQMVGLPADYDMSLMKIVNMHPPWAFKLIEEVAIPTVFAKGHWTGETALLHHSGREIPVLQSINLHRDSEGSPVCLTTVMRDITERKVQEAALKASEETFRSAMQYSAIGMALVSPKGKWLKVNHAFCEMVGYSQKELVKISFQHITHPDDLAIDLDYIHQLLSKKINTYQLEKRYFHKDGHIIWVLLSVSLVSKANGKPKYFIAQIQNISDRKAAEAANDELIKALAESNTELERFAYIASHDLQEPVRMINNFGRLLLNEKLSMLDEEAKDYLNIVTDAGERMRDMINDLLAYSRIGHEAMNWKMFDTELILKGAMENINTLIEEQQAQITYDKLPSLYGSSMQIMRLFQNLMVNAIKYHREGVPPQIHIRVKDEGSHWIISIEDNGLGIDEQFINDIFEPFRRLHSWEKIKGTGLGLSICKKIAEIHGGTLTLTSILGKGSIFYLLMPKHNERNDD